MTAGPVRETENGGGGASDDPVLVERGDGVVTLRFNRPAKKNALNRAMYAALACALCEADADATVGAILLAGRPGAFSAGNDIADFAAIAEGGAAPDEIADFLHALVACETPLIAAVDGLAIGIGTTLLLHCDLAFATPRSVFRTPFTDLGLTPEAASSLIAPRLMGHQKAFALLVMGEAFDAETACGAGLVYRVVGEGEAETEAARAAAALAAKPRQAVAIARRLMRADGETVRERIDREIDHFVERLASPEAQAAFRSFLDR